MTDTTVVPLGKKLVLCLGFGPTPVKDISPFQADGVMVVHRTFQALCAELLKDLDPLCVIVPLFGSGFDAGVAILRLQDLGYQGRLRVLSPNLPNPDMVIRELNGLAPLIEVEIISLT